MRTRSARVQPRADRARHPAPRRPPCRDQGEACAADAGARDAHRERGAAVSRTECRECGYVSSRPINCAHCGGTSTMHEVNDELASTRRELERVKAQVTCTGA